MYEIILIECPFDWYRFNTSCYKNYDAEGYSNAMVILKLLLFFIYMKNCKNELFFLLQIFLNN